MAEKVHLGTVGHFGLSVRNPKASARWWRERFDLDVIFEGDDYIGLSNDDVTIVLQQGVPHPGTLGHMSFHLPTIRALEHALALLKSRDTKIEDPGDEIGPEAPGSKNMGLWFHDPDGYRWELSVQAGS